MVTEVNAAREAWLKANELARLKAEELKAAWNAYFDRRSPVPTDELIREVAELRAAADASLKDALAALDRATESGRK